MAKKNARKKTKAKSPKATATAVIEEEEDELDLDDGIDEVDDAVADDDLDDDYEEDALDDEEAEDALDDEDDDEAEETEDDEDDEAEDDEEEGEAEDDDEEPAFSENFDTVDYAPADLTMSIKRDVNSPEVKEMIKSIRNHGLLNAVLIGTDSVVIAGNRRTAALTKLGRMVPCRVAVDSEGNQIASTEFAAQMQTLAENINRSEMTPLEQGRAFNNLIENGQAEDATQLAKSLGLSKGTVTKYMNLAKDATTGLVTAIEEGKITTDAALTILRRAKTESDQGTMLTTLLDASNGRKVSGADAKKSADSSGKKTKDKRGRKSTKFGLSDEAMMTDETNISAVLRVDRENNTHTVKIVVEIDYDKETFARFNLEKQIQTRLSKMDMKAVRAELEVARLGLAAE